MALICCFYHLPCTLHESFLQIDASKVPQCCGELCVLGWDSSLAINLSKGQSLKDVSKSQSTLKVCQCSANRCLGLHFLGPNCICKSSNTNIWMMLGQGVALFQTFVNRFIDGKQVKNSHSRHLQGFSFVDWNW